MRALAKTPAVLSLLLLAAHFLHADRPEIAIVCLASPLLLLVKRRAVIRIVQVLLFGGAMVWLWTMVALAEVFQSIGRPSLRMMIILTSVAAFTAISAMLLEISLTARPRHA
jgi:hypothetical protein